MLQVKSQYGFWVRSWQGPYVDIFPSTALHIAQLLHRHDLSRRDCLVISSDIPTKSLRELTVASMDLSINLDLAIFWDQLVRNGDLSGHEVSYQNMLGRGSTRGLSFDLLFLG